MIAIVDSSAFLAVVLAELAAEAFFRIVNAAEPALVSAGNIVEIFRVVQARAPKRLSEVDLLMTELSLEIAPVDAAQTRLARDGMERFGKGRGAGPAVLSFGDLFAYALARAMQAPLPFNGYDFRATDVVPAWTP